MTKYVKKPETIEAFHVSGDNFIPSLSGVTEWIEARTRADPRRQSFIISSNKITIRTKRKRIQFAYPGDWLVFGADKLITSLDDDEFEKTYALENTTTIINVDSRGAEQGIEEKISEVLAEVLPLAMAQASDMAVVHIRNESKGSGRGKI